MGNKTSMKVNYIYNVLYQLSALLLPMITTPYVSRVLNVDGIGVYSYTLSIVTYFSMFATLGVSVYGQLEIAACRNDENQRNKIFWEIFIARVLTTAVILVVYIAYIALNPQYKIMYLVMSLNIFGAMIDISWYLQGLELFKITVTRNIIVKLLGTALIFLFVHDKSDLIKYALILQGTYFLANFSLWAYVRKNINFVPLKQLRIFRHWKNSIVYFIPSLASSIYTVLDISMIGWITGSEFENGYYDQAHKIEQMLVAIVTSMGAVTMPRIKYLLSKELKEEAKNIVNSTTEFVIFLAMPMMVGLMAVSKYLVPWFLGENFTNSVPILQIFSILILIVGLDNTIGKQCLMASGKQKQFNMGVILGAIVNAALNLILIRLFAAKGAAIASVTAEIVILIIFIYYSRELLDLSKMLRTLFKYGIYSILMGAIAYFVASRFAKTNFTAIIIEVVVAVCVYALILIVSRDSMFKQAKQMFNNKLHRTIK